MPHFQAFSRRSGFQKQTLTSIASETVVLIQPMAHENRLRGAERIGGELLKLGFPVAKHTIQKYINHIRPAKLAANLVDLLEDSRQRYLGCDFLTVIDLWFRPLFLFFIAELAWQRMVHGGVTRSPTDAWVAHPGVKRHRSDKRYVF